MHFTILTLFPDMVMSGLNDSIIKRATDRGLISISTVNIRDFSQDKHKRVDDYTYGGGAGMLMQAEPVYQAITSVPKEKRARVVYVTPQGRPFTQKLAEEFAKESSVLFLCGHYEGIDERVLDECVTDYVSIGDYVLTGGELASMVMIDAISRLVPGVLHNEVSAETESFQGDLLEYPQYSRPEVWHDVKVPDVLMSGNMKNIRVWRLEQSIQRTKERRPDLYARYEQMQAIRERLLQSKLMHMDMIALIDRGTMEIVAENEKEVLLYDRIGQKYYHTLYDAFEKEPTSIDFLQKLGIKSLDKNIDIVEHRGCCASNLIQQIGAQNCNQFYLCSLTRKEKLPVRSLYTDVTIEPYTDEYESLVESLCEKPKAYQAGFVACYRGEPAGCIFLMNDQSIGLFAVKGQLRRKHIGLALATYLFNQMIENGQTPFAYVAADNVPAMELQKKIGMYASKNEIYCIQK